MPPLEAYLACLRQNPQINDIFSLEHHYIISIETLSCIIFASILAREHIAEEKMVIVGMNKPERDAPNDPLSLTERVDTGLFRAFHAWKRLIE
jgi:hypothetical protein